MAGGPGRDIPVAAGRTNDNRSQPRTPAQQAARATTEASRERRPKPAANADPATRTNDGGPGSPRSCLAAEGRRPWKPPMFRPTVTGYDGTRDGFEGAACFVTIPVIDVAKARSPSIREEFGSFWKSEALETWVSKQKERGRFAMSFASAGDMKGVHGALFYSGRTLSLEVEAASGSASMGSENKNEKKVPTSDELQAVADRQQACAGRAREILEEGLPEFKELIGTLLQKTSGCFGRATYTVGEFVSEFGFSGEEGPATKIISLRHKDEQVPNAASFTTLKVEEGAMDATVVALRAIPENGENGIVGKLFARVDATTLRGCVIYESARSLKAGAPTYGLGGCEFTRAVLQQNAFGVVFADDGFNWAE